MRKKQDELAVSVKSVQNFLRAFASQKKTSELSLKKYGLPENKQTNYPALLAGSGPNSLSQFVDKKRQNPFVLIGNSCFFLFKVAIELCDQNNFDLIKKVVVLDNSRSVNAFWDYIKIQFARFSDMASLSGALKVNSSEWSHLISTDDDKVFIKSLPLSSEFQPFRYDTNRVIVNGFFEILNYLNTALGYLRLQSLVLGALVIPTDWSQTDNGLFEELNRFTRQNEWELVSYSSNILCFIDEVDATPTKEKVNGFLKNIALMRPVVSIYSDMKYFYVKPFGAPHDFVSFPSRMMCFDGVGDPIANGFGACLPVAQNEDQLDNVKFIYKNFVLSIRCLNQRGYDQMLSHARFAYTEFNKTASMTSIFECFFQYYILGRLYGIALLKNDQHEEGMKYLDASLSSLKDFYGNCEIVADYELEIKSLKEQAQCNFIS